jgi:hypothetical protein
MVEPATYPQRPKFWAMTVIRTLQKTGAANHIGRDAAWLITTIATMEDVKRYTGPVAFWNSHLMDVTGFGHKKTFLKARAAAVEFGWLIYTEGRKGKAATYWTAIPDSAIQFLGTSVLDENAGPDADHKTQCRSESGPPSGPESGPESGPHSYPSPIPEEEGGAALPATSAVERKKTQSPKYPPHFEHVWAAYPAIRRKNKGRTFTEYQKAVQRVAAADSGDTSKAAAWLLSRVRDFAASHYGQKFAPEPLRWFRDDRFHDSPEAWRPFNTGSGSSPLDAEVENAWQIAMRSIRRHSRFEPNAIRADVGERAWHVLELIGLKRIDEANEFDLRELRTRFTQAFGRELEAA